MSVGTDSILLILYIYMWHVGYNFLTFRLKRVQRRVVSGSVDVGLWCYVRTLRRVLTSWCYVMTSFVTSHGTCAQAIKQPGAVSWGDTLVQLLLGKEVHVHAWIDALERPHWESLLPSNITDWVVLIHLCASAPADAPITLWEWPGNAVFFLRSTASTGPSCLSVGARVHYL